MSIVTPQSAPPRVTVFLDDLAITSWQSFLHQLSIAQTAGAPLLRLITLVWFGVAFLGLVGSFPGGMPVGILLLIGLLVFHVHFFLQRRADFVRFEPTNMPLPQPSTLRVEEKVAIYVTGECSVEGKRRRFSCLPGFYRTFATREHALLCQVKDRRILGIASWKRAEIGLWYVFFRPSAINKIQIGTLRYGRNLLPTVAIEYLATTKFNKMGEPEKSQLQTVFVSTPQNTEIEFVLADLLVDVPKQIIDQITTNIQQSK